MLSGKFDGIGDQVSQYSPDHVHICLYDRLVFEACIQVDFFIGCLGFKEGNTLGNQHLHVGRFRPEGERAGLCPCPEQEVFQQLMGLMGRTPDDFQ